MKIKHKVLFTRHALQRYRERFCKPDVAPSEIPKLLATDLYAAREWRAINNDTRLSVYLGEKYGYTSKLYINGNKVFVIDTETDRLITVFNPNAQPDFKRRVSK